MTFDHACMSRIAGLWWPRPPVTLLETIIDHGDIVDTPIDCFFSGGLSQLNTGQILFLQSFFPLIAVSVRDAVCDCIAHVQRSMY